MVVLKTFGIFLLALAGELGGTYAVWRWLRAGATPLPALAAWGLLLGYASVAGGSSPDVRGRH